MILILEDSQPHYLPEAGRFICNRISLNGVDCSTMLYFSLLENNNFKYMYNAYDYFLKLNGEGIIMH